MTRAERGFGWPLPPETTQGTNTTATEGTIDWHDPRTRTRSYDAG